MMEEAPKEVAADESDLKWIIESLAEGSRVLPEQAIRAAQENRQRAVPLLIDALRRATEDAARGIKVESNAHFFALFLLAEFRAQEGWPAIRAAISLPGEAPFDLFGDAITEDLAPIMSVFVESADELDAIIDDRQINEYVRWQAMYAFLYLVRDGRLTRAEALARLERHLRAAIERKECAAISSLIITLSDYGPVELAELIREAFRSDLANEFLIDRKDVEEGIQEGDARFQRELQQLP
ncbi:MAG: DUF1186 domain-containing protein, partial [Planctomycetaceae bacterium]